MTMPTNDIKSGRREYFKYGREQISWLKKRDGLLGATIERIGPVRREIHPDPFLALARAVIGQQISNQAQAAVWGRFQEFFQPLTPARIAAIDPEELMRCGTSLRKAGYIAGIAKAFATGRLNGKKMGKMDDAALEALLLELPGVGKWTTEMLLIFTFARPNILSFGDLAIRRGMARLYGHETITREIFERHRAVYSPFATVAGLYLWEIAAEKDASASGKRQTGRARLDVNSPGRQAKI